MSIITNLRFNRHINVTVLRCPIIYNISYGWKNVTKCPSGREAEMPAVARHCQPVPVTPVLTVTNPCNNCHAPKPANPAGAGAGGVLEKSIRDLCKIPQNPLNSHQDI